MKRLRKMRYWETNEILEPVSSAASIYEWCRKKTDDTFCQRCSDTFNKSD